MVKYEASCIMISYLMCFQMFVYNEFGSIDFGHTVGKYNLLYNEFGSIDWSYSG